MFIICNEEKARKIFEADYKNTVVFGLGKTTKGYVFEDGSRINYERVNFLPDEDTINGIIAGDIKLKKALKDVKKAIKKPSTKTDQTIGLAVAQLMSVVGGGSKKPIVVVFVTDPEGTNDDRTKVVVKFLKKVLKCFKIKPLTKGKAIKEIFKKPKKVVKRILEYIGDHKKVALHVDGSNVRKNLIAYYEVELRFAGLAGRTIDDVDKKTAKTWAKTMYNIVSGENLLGLGKDDMKVGKAILKKDKKIVDAWADFRDIIKSSAIKTGKLPKIKFGQKKDEDGKPIGGKCSKKKLKALAKKDSTRWVLPVFFAHVLMTISLGYKAGTKEYNKGIKSILEGYDKELYNAYTESVNRLYASAANK